MFRKGPNQHMMFRSGNPALGPKTFAGFDATSGPVMSVEGAVNRVGVSLLILLIFGALSFNAASAIFLIPALILSLVLGLVTVFKKHLSFYTVPAYAAAQGVVLGGISYFFNEMFEGIVFQAVSLTVAILAALLFAYKSRLIKVTENFKLGVAAATGGIFLLYFVQFIGGFFGLRIAVLDIANSSLMSIGFSLLVIVIASLNLVLDFDFIEEGAEKGVPKYMEWYAAFGLLTTLVWLYLEILRLLAKMRSR
ncbi:MAG: Bax inhibitor-1/YccA family protein [Dehalococcoidia bacterium]